MAQEKGSTLSVPLSSETDCRETVFVDEFSCSIQLFGMSHLQALQEARFLNAREPLCKQRKSPAKGPGISGGPAFVRAGRTLSP